MRATDAPRALALAVLLCIAAAGPLAALGLLAGCRRAAPTAPAPTPAPAAGSSSRAASAGPPADCDARRRQLEALLGRAHACKADGDCELVPNLVVGRCGNTAVDRATQRHLRSLYNPRCVAPRDCERPARERPACVEHRCAVRAP